jgi:hypothetical protein
MRTQSRIQPRTGRGEFTFKQHAEDDIALAISDEVNDAARPAPIREVPRTEKETERKDLTVTSTYTGIDELLALPCKQYARLHTASSRTTNAAYRAELERLKEELLTQTGRIGTVLDDRGGGMGLGLFNERFEFVTPDGAILTVGVFRAAILAARFCQVHGLYSRLMPDGAYRVYMTRWPDDAPKRRGKGVRA